MNEKWMRPVELVEIILNFLTVFFLETALFSAFVPLGSAVESDAFYPAPLTAQLLLVTVPACFWLIRIFVSRFWLFMLLHAAVFAAAVGLLGDDVFQRVLFGFFAALYLIVSFRARLQDRREEEGLLGPVAAAIAAAVSFLLCAYLGDGAACGRILNAALLYALLFFADTYMRNLERFVQFNKSSNAHIPVRRMLIRGGGLTLGCSICVVALLALGTNQPFMDRAGEILQNGILWLVRGLLRLVGLLLSLFGRKEGGTEIAAQQEASVQQFMTAEIQEQPFWVEILLQMLQYLFLAAGAAFLIFLLYRVVAAAVRRFNEGKVKRTEDGQKAEEIRETLRTERRKRKKEDSLRIFARTPEEKIRRIFVRTIQHTARFRNPEGRPGGERGRDLWRKDARESLVRAKTARELAFLLDGHGGETENSAFEELARLYEKARYAGISYPKGMPPDDGQRREICTAEDVKRAEACRAELAGKKG
ncbi:MAG TPA: hypothetical protein H9717_05405 [Candidatus Eisenbergiella merdipullorum]|uniref:DUF4129 domain-containing protein n=1 Tax=Candidatus Eisenbergiella merdipullorum TaxID=2838553 RepID=A0A9D2L0R6_9FIRM|nr:hypothetical protein [Candidatus Eisenbergiella merdipullorum]